MNKKIIAPIFVAALGYFVDIYDLLLFSIVRKTSLESFGISGDELLTQGIHLLNMQMIGMLFGGILWGILGDKKGRISVLFGSIFIYSLANILNGMVTSVEQYALLRFIAGIGLAGELGAGITLVSEIMPKESRGYGTTIVATIGILGAVVASFVGKWFDWRTSYYIGGALGGGLLLLRIGLYESGIFEKVKEENVKRGDFFSLLSSSKVFFKYLNCILVGLPIWCVIGIYVTFTPEFGKAFGMSEVPLAGEAVKYAYIGLSLGDLTSGFLSQYFKSRKKVLLGFLILTAITIISYFFMGGTSLFIYYLNCGLMGFAIGYWAIFMTIASENFGTNIRATVTTTAPNFIRASVVPLTFLFEKGKNIIGLQNSGLVLGFLTIFIALISLYKLDETYGKDLNYIEDI
ncbi:MAG: MFS transporter [Candidatus Sericytochromatia bacterium]